MLDPDDQKVRLCRLVCVCLNVKVLFVFDAIRDRDLTLMYCPKTTMVTTVVPWTNRRYVCMTVCLNLKVIFGVDIVCSRNFTWVWCTHTHTH